MSDLIQFLEHMGSDARLSHLNETDYLAAVEAASLDDAPKQALRSRDAGMLNELAGGRLQMMCILFPAEGDDNKQDESEESDQPDDDTKESVHLAGLN
ncbi:MAG TPA: hypothetical protein VIM90_09880 [Arenimonas sp.]